MFEPQLCNLKILNGTSGVTVFINHKDCPFFVEWGEGRGSVAAPHRSENIEHLQNDFRPRHDARTYLCSLITP